MQELNMVDLIENNPITKISNTYQCKLLQKIKDNFTDMEQQMFVASFYGYLNYNSKTEFVIDLDTIWEWLGFSQKIRAKELLNKLFIIDIDYTILLSFEREQKYYEEKKHGGHNIQKIMMTIKTFKSLCLKAGTKKADQIHDYYIKLEEILHETIGEECAELKLQLEETELKLHDTALELEQKENELEEQEDKNQLDKELLREKTILEHFPDNVQCVYYGLIDNVSSKNESLFKFGMSNFLCNRVDSHKKTFTNFRLINAFKVENTLQIENAIKKHPILSIHRRHLFLNKINANEFLCREKLSFEQLDTIIKNIISSIEYSPANYQKLLDENEHLLNENEKLSNALKVIKEEFEPEVDTEKTKHHYRQPDGLYHIDDHIFTMLCGTRQEVWDNKAYKTVGGLTKHDLIMNKSGNIVSKAKFIICKSEPSRFSKSDQFRKEQTLAKKNAYNNLSL